MKDNALENNNNETTENNQIILVIYNISRNLTRNHLQEIFNAYGTVKGVYIPKDEETKLPKNYAFVEYEKQNEGDKASLYMGGGQIDGLIIRTEILNPKYYNQKEKQKEKQKHQSRSRDKEMILNEQNKNNTHLKDNNTSNNSKNNRKDTQRRKRYNNNRRSSKSP